MNLPIKVSDRGPVAAACAQGAIHHRYEDRFRLLTRSAPQVAEAGRGEIFAVCDGISKLPGGMSAAQAVVDALLEFYRDPGRYPVGIESLRDLLMLANLDIHGWEEPGGCVGTVAWLYDDLIHLLHVGDTKVLACREDTLVQLTEDRDWKYSRYGLGPHLEIMTSSHRVDDFDRLVLISDGVTEGLPNIEAIGSILDSEEGAAQAARSLVQQAQAAGSKDDLTVVVVNLWEME